MAIIYSYPKKSPLSLSDLVLITDESNNKTNNGTIADIKEVIDVVDSLSATLPIQVSGSTGGITVSSRTYAGGSTTGHVPAGGTASTFLKGDGTWGTGGISGSGTNGVLPLWNGTNSLTDSPIKYDGARITIPDYIWHEGDLSSRFGFDANDSFLVFVGDASEERIVISNNLFQVKTDSGTKISAGADNAVLWVDDGVGGAATAALGTQVTGVYIKGNGTNKGTVRYYAGDDNGYVGIEGPTSMTSTNYTVTLPPDAPTGAGKVLVTTGSQQLAWGNAGGPGTGTQNSIAYWDTTSTLGDSIITQPSSQQINIAATANSTPTTLQVPIATASGPNGTLGGINIYGGLYNVAQANISPATSAGLIQFGSQLDGQTFDFRNNKIAFDSDATNTYIKANTSTPESLEIHADQDIQLRPDGYVVIFTGAAAPTTASDSGDQGSIVYDDNYLYVCVQDDTWKRVALTSW